MPLPVLLQIPNHTLSIKYHDWEIEFVSVLSKLRVIIDFCHNVIASDSKAAKSQELLSLEYEGKHFQIELNKKSSLDPRFDS